MTDLTNSPLPKLVRSSIETDGSINLSQQETMGTLMALFATSWSHREFEVKDWFDTVQHQLKHHHNHIFFNDQLRPYGFASWCFVDDKTHERLIDLKDSQLIEEELENLTVKSDHKQHANNLWFTSIVRTFDEPSSLIPILKNQFESHPTAWFVEPISNDSDNLRAW